MTAHLEDQATSTAGLPSCKTMIGGGHDDALQDEDGETVTVTLELRVWDAKAFRAAARDRALVEGESSETAASFLDPEAKTLGECAQMLFDPGSGPDGCEVLESSAG